MSRMSPRSSDAGARGASDGALRGTSDGAHRRASDGALRGASEGAPEGLPAGSRDRTSEGAFGGPPDGPSQVPSRPRARFEMLLDQLRVTVIGAGRAGSFACLALGMAGVRRLRVYDHDRLDPERNLAVQLYRASDVRRRRPKVEALQRVLRDLCPGTAVEGVADRFPDGATGPAGPVVVFGMDTMDARRRAAEALCRDESVGWLIDVRLGGSVAQVHSVRGASGLAAYRAGLYSDEDSWAGKPGVSGQLPGDACADSPDPHVALASASIVAASVLSYVRGEEFAECVIVDVGGKPWMGVMGGGDRPARVRR
jgi:hypothetical protein